MRLKQNQAIVTYSSTTAAVIQWLDGSSVAMELSQESWCAKNFVTWFNCVINHVLGKGT